MSNGWVCENCREFHLAVHLKTQIIVSFEPRDFAAEIMLCSLKCFDEMREELNDLNAWAQEHDESRPKFRQVVVEEEL